MGRHFTALYQRSLAAATVESKVEEGGALRGP